MRCAGRGSQLHRVTFVAALLAPTETSDRSIQAVATFDHTDFPHEMLLAAKRERGISVHVLIPARDEEATIGDIVRTIRVQLMDDVSLVDSLVVVDDASLDATAARAAESGARIVDGPGLGKGEAMATATAGLPARSIAVFLDGDVVGFHAGFVTGLVGPLLADPGIDLVKGAYRRPLGPSPSGGGRVTELVAKPALSLCFPELAGMDQPLAGETAIRASLLAELQLAPGYAVEVAMLIDAYELRGPAVLAQVDLGERRHRNRSLEELVPEARAVLGTILERAERLRERTLPVEAEA